MAMSRYLVTWLMNDGKSTCTETMLSASMLDAVHVWQAMNPCKKIVKVTKT